MSYTISDITVEQFANATVVNSNVINTDLMYPRYNADMHFGANLLPTLDLTYNIGIPLQRWKTVNVKDLYASGNLVPTGNTTFIDQYTVIQNINDASKKFKFDASPVSANTLLTYLVPNVDTTLVGANATQTLTNKTIIGSTNTVAASQLRTTGSDVIIKNSSPPFSGYALIAGNATNATWQSLSSVAVTSAKGTANQALVNNTSGVSQTGNITISTPIRFLAPGNIQDTTGLLYSTTTGIIAAGTVQGNATSLTTSFDVVSSVPSGSGVKLPTASPGLIVTIVNRGSNALNVYPNIGAKIDSNSSNAAVTLATGRSSTFQAGNNSQWYTVDPPSVISITAGTGLTGGTITNTGTIALSIPVSIANGGTNSTTALTNGKIMVSSGGQIVEGTSSTTPTFLSETLTATTNQLTLGTTNTVTINATAPAASRTYTLSDPGANANFIMDTAGAMNITNSASLGQYLIATGTNTATWQTPTPPAGTISIKNNGSNIANTPHSALNFLTRNGVTISASDYVSGIANVIVTLPTTTKGDLIAYTGTTNARLAVGTNGYILTANSAATTGISWSPFTSGLTLKNNNTNVTGTPHTALNFLSSAGVTISASNYTGGTANVVVTLPTTTKGDLIAYTGTTNTRLAAGTNTYVLTANSAATTGLSWSIPTFIGVKNQGTTISGSPFANLNFVNGGFYTISASNYTGNTANVTVTKNTNVVTPPNITANQNNYNPTGLSTAFQIRLFPTSATPPWQVTGLQAPGAGAQELILTNVSGNTVILSHESASSTAANRFFFDGQNAALIGGQTMKVVYDTTSSRWRGTSASSIGDLGGSFVISGVISPSLLSTNQNNYSPTGLSDASTMRLTSNALVSITGIATGTSGKILNLVNVGTNPITLVSNSVSSSAGNRLLIGSTNATLVGGAIATLLYDGVSSGWRLTGGTGGATSGAGGLVQSQWVEVTQDMQTTATTWPSNNTTINAAGTLPTGTITVVSTTGFPTSGKIVIQTTSNGPQIVTYTGTTGTTFTGCTGGSGAYPLGAFVWQYPVQTTIAAGSNGQILPQTTINVASTTNFPASGTILVTTSDGTQRVTYTGTTATTFTGCTGGTGTMSTGGIVTNVAATTQDLMNINLTTTGGSLIISATASATTKNNATAYFQVLVDGIVIRGGSTQGNGAAPAGSVVIGLKLSSVPAGDHVVVVRWRVQPVAGAYCNIYPVTGANDNNASLLVQEVTS
jgi:hypothetical protein